MTRKEQNTSKWGLLIFGGLILQIVYSARILNDNGNAVFFTILGVIIFGCFMFSPEFIEVPE